MKIFSNIYTNVNAMSHLVWKFRRYAIVMEYERIPALPPPLILFCHIKMIIDVVKKRRLIITNGLSKSPYLRSATRNKLSFVHTYSTYRYTGT